MRKPWMKDEANDKKARDEMLDEAVMIV